jgi:lipopolysaccharide transport system ATP-binding protein
VSTPQLAIEATGLGKAFRLARRPAHGALLDKFGGVLSRRPPPAETLEPIVWAVRGVDLSIPQGQIFGIIGRNGSGKTTLLKLLARVTAPTEGTAVVRGRVAALLQVGAGFHPMLTGRDNIALSGAILGMSGDEVQERFEDIVSFSEVGRYLDQPVKNYSSGMYARLAFSVAAFLPAEIVLIDEVLSVGDADFQAKAQAHMKATLKDGRTVVYVGHGLDIVRELCSDAMVMDRGRVQYSGTADEAVDWYEEQVAKGRVAPESTDGRRPNRRLVGRRRAGSGVG